MQADPVARAVIAGQVELQAGLACHLTGLAQDGLGLAVEQGAVVGCGQLLQLMLGLRRCLMGMVAMFQFMADDLLLRLLPPTAQSGRRTGRGPPLRQYNTQAQLHPGFKQLALPVDLLQLVMQMHLPLGQPPGVATPWMARAIAGHAGGQIGGGVAADRIVLDRFADQAARGAGQGDAQQGGSTEGHGRSLKVIATSLARPRHACLPSGCGTITTMKTSCLRVDRILAWAVPGCLLLVAFVVWQSAQTWADEGRSIVSTSSLQAGQSRLWPCPGFVVTAAGSVPAGTLAIDFHPPFQKPYGLRLLADGQLQRARGSVGYRFSPVPPPPPGLDGPWREQGVYDWREAWLDQPIVAQWMMSSYLRDVPGAWRTETRIPPALADRVSRSVFRQLAWLEEPSMEGLLLLDPMTVVIRQQGYCGLLEAPRDETTAARLLWGMADVLFHGKTYYRQPEQALAELAARLDRTLGQQPWLQMGADPAISKAAEDSGLYGHRLPGRSPYRPPTAQEGSWAVQGPWRPVTRQAGIAAGL